MTKSSEHEARESLDEAVRKERLRKAAEEFARTVKDDAPLNKKDSALLLLYVVAGFAAAVYAAFVIIQWKGFA